MSEDTNVIDFSSHAGVGTENISNEDLQVPFLQIIQNNSPEVDKSNQDYATKGIEGASAGDIFNSVTREIIAKYGDPAKVIPVGYQKSYVEWRPREDGGGMVQVHTDPSILNECERNEKNKYVLPNGNNVETTAYHFVMYQTPSGNWERAIISMQSTQLKKSRQWLSKITSITMQGDDGKPFTPPIFSHYYNLTSVTESNQYGSWFGWKVETDGPVDDGVAFGQAVAANKQTTAAIEQSTAKELESNPF